MSNLVPQETDRHLAGYLLEMFARNKSLKSASVRVGNSLHYELLFTTPVVLRTNDGSYVLWLVDKRSNRCWYLQTARGQIRSFKSIDVILQVLWKHDYTGLVHFLREDSEEEQR